MIYIATVHWESDKWVDIQSDYLHRYITEEFRVFAYLSNLPNDHSNKYYYSSTDNIKSHELKLNILARNIIADSESDEDIVIFIDGDAFPIADIIGFAKLHLTKRKLIAIKRSEENGEQQPHPCFCLTTVGFWKEINGDWKRGYKWKNNNGQYVTDVGGNLLGILEQYNVDWFPLLRSNKKNIHPVLFGVYEDLVYHHGAGFRYPVFRMNFKSANKFHFIIELFIQKYVPEKLRYIFPRSFRYRFRSNKKVVDSNLELSNKIYSKINRDFNFIQSYLLDAKE